MVQNQFLANPCWSRVPWLPNCKQRENFLEHVIQYLIVVTLYAKFGGAFTNCNDIQNTSQILTGFIVIQDLSVITNLV